MRKQFILTILVFLQGFLLKAQNDNTLTFERFKQLVLQNHPVVKQAALRSEFGEKELLKSKGLLDPVFTSEINGKEFDGKNYYELSTTGLKIPTWVGIDVKAGYEINRGYYLGPDDKTPTSGLWFAGIELPIGEGLLFDERRAIIQQAKVFVQSTKNEQELIVNDLLLDAYSSYWNWYETYRKYLIAKEGLDFASIRFAGVKENARLGEVPYIDTMEAKIQLDSRTMDFIQAENEWKNARLILNVFLWNENNIPLELEVNTFPVNQIQAQFPSGTLKLRFQDSSINSVPMVLSTVYKLQQLKIEEKWKKEQLKPTVNLRYTPLSQPVGNNPFAQFSANNYKYGLSVYMPLFLRKERGAFAQAKLKVENAQLDLQYKQAEMKAKEEALRNELTRLYEQWEIQQKQVVQAKALRDSEQIRFEIGESSLFLVNSREMSYLGYKFKLAEIENKLKVTEAKWLWLFSELD